jgi:hypothetical protein
LGERGGRRQHESDDREESAAHHRADQSGAMVPQGSRWPGALRKRTNLVARGAFLATVSQAHVHKTPEKTAVLAFNCSYHGVKLLLALNEEG